MHFNGRPDLPDVVGDLESKFYDDQTDSLSQMASAWDMSSPCKSVESVSGDLVESTFDER